MKLELLEKKFYKNPKERYFFPLANAYRENERLDECIQILRQGLSVFPCYWAAKVALGRALFEKGDVDDALKELESASIHIPENILLHGLLASIYLKKGDISKAFHHCELVLFVNPHHAEAIRIMEEVLKIRNMGFQGKSFHEYENKSLFQEKAKEALDKKEEENEIKPEALLEESKESRVKEEPGKKRVEENEEKQETLEKQGIFSIKEEDEIVTVTLAELYISQGIPEKAVEIYQKLIEQQPELKKEWERRIASLQEVRCPVVTPSENHEKKKGPNEAILRQLEAWLKNIDKCEKTK